MTTPPPPTPDGGGGAPPRRDAAWVFLLALVALSGFAWVRDLWDADEGRYAAVALDMVRRGDYVTPREAGMRFMDKPALIYWLQAGAFHALGATPFAARLPSLVAGALLCAVVFLFARAWTRDRVRSWFCAGVAATSAAVVGFSRVSPQTDMWLTASTTTALYGAYRALGSDAIRHRLVLGAGVGLGLLSKGALGVLVPALVAVAWAVAGAPWRRVLRTAFSPTAWLVAIAIAAPWYALVERANPGYLAHFFWYEHVGRYRQAGHRNFIPLWLYLPVLPLMLLPWTPYLWRARLRGAAEVRGPRAVRAERLAWAWALVLLGFFSLAKNKLFTYILPAVPPLLLLAGARLAEVVSGPRAAVAGWWAFAVGAGVAVAGFGIAIGWPFQWGWIEDPRVRAIGFPGAFAGVALLSVPLLFRSVRSVAARGAVLFVATTALWWGLDLAAARADSMRSARALAEVLVRESRPGDLLVALDRYPQGVRFYADVDVRIAENPKRGAKHTQREIVEPWATYDGAGRLLTMEELRAAWLGPTRVLLVGREIDLRAEFPDGRFVAGPLAGASRADLWVVSNR